MIVIIHRILKTLDVLPGATMVTWKSKVETRSAYTATLMPLIWLESDQLWLITLLSSFINVKNLIHLKFYSWSIMNGMILWWIIYLVPEGMQSIDMRSMGRCWTDLHEVGFLVFVEFDSWFFLAWRIHLVTMSENKTVKFGNCRSSCNDNDGLVHWIIDSLYYGWRLLDKLYSD